MKNLASLPALPPWEEHEEQYGQEYSMKLSTRGRYGTRLMLELARNYGRGPVSIAEISKRQRIPLKYLEQLIIPLKKASLVTSMRGPRGGHMLSTSPHEISLWDILVLLESKCSFVDCLKDDTCCRNTRDCPVRPVWGRTLEAIMGVLKKTTLNDLLLSQGASTGSRESSRDTVQVLP
jgi:Rrf2 family protein